MDSSFVLKLGFRALHWLPAAALIAVIGHGHCKLSQRRAMMRPPAAPHWRSQGPYVVAGAPAKANYAGPATPGAGPPEQAVRTSYSTPALAHVAQSGMGTPRSPPVQQPMVVRLSSYTPRVPPRGFEEPVGASAWTPEMAMATWPAPGASLRSPRNSLQGLSTPRDDSPSAPTDPAERAALRAKLKILPSSKGVGGGAPARPEIRPASPGSRSLSPWSRRGGKPTVQRLQSPRAALRRSGSGASATIPVSQPPGPQLACRADRVQSLVWRVVQRAFASC
eukprot:s305_g6.t1